jgi:hypothetical protein
MIVNATTERPGTLGCIARDNQGAAWIVSCYHVLARVKGAISEFQDNEEIWQSTAEQGGSKVAVTATAMADERLDVAAARVLDDVDVCGDVLELHDVKGVGRAVEGMRVLKSGADTGVTEGTVTEVVGSLVTIGVAEHMPREYVLCDHGDSGAIWMDANTGLGVAIHFAGRNGDTAFARDLATALQRLGLHL